MEIVHTSRHNYVKYRDCWLFNKLEFKNWKVSRNLQWLCRILLSKHLASKTYLPWKSFERVAHKNTLLPFFMGMKEKFVFFLQKFIPIYFDRIRNHGGPGLVWLQCQIVSWSQFPKGWDDSVGKASVKRLVEGISQWKARPHSRQIHHAKNEASINNEQINPQTWN